MNLFQKQPKTSGYNTIPNTIAVDDETAAVPLGTTLLSPSTTTTRGRRSSKRRRIASVAAGMMLLVMMVAGGTVWMRQDDGLSYNYSSGSLETEDGSLTTTWGPPGSCVPATGTWTAGPVSTTAWWGQATPFLTCWQQDQSYCWTRSHYTQCIPNGWWHLGDPYIRFVPTINVGLEMCGPPCQDQHEAHHCETCSFDPQCKYASDGRVC